MQGRTYLIKTFTCCNREHSKDIADKCLAYLVSCYRDYLARHSLAEDAVAAYNAAYIAWKSAGSEPATEPKRNLFHLEQPLIVQTTGEPKVG